MRSPFAPGWWSFDLGAYRPGDGTYDLYPYESLPPLDERLFRGDFAWLAPARARPRRAREVDALAAAAAARGVPLPAAFVRFMADPGLQAAVPSCTACEWDPSAAPVPCRVVPGAYTVRFLRDQQDCLFWYVHLLPGGEAPVLCSPIPFDDPELEVSREVTIANTWVCAPHFESFVYRFWIENEVWDLLEAGPGERTPAQDAYLAHYAAANAARKKVVAKKAATKKAATKKAATKKAATKKAATKKAATKKTATKKAAAKKTATKKAATKKTAVKKTATKKTARGL